jgi:thiamine-phosphate pyrophosphorylase
MKADADTRRGLYAITPEDLVGSALIEAAGQVLTGGAVCLQYRAKDAFDVSAARALAALCRSHGARFIVNDAPALALDVGADGVHLGRDDGSVAAARALLGPDRIIGVSCYADLERARRLAAEGADYLAFGSLFASPTKPEEVSCPLAVLGAARSFGLPVVAIGGITLANAPLAIEAGADQVAVISDLFDAPDRRARAAAFDRLFHDFRNEVD